MAVTIERPVAKPAIEKVFVIEKTIDADTGTVSEGYFLASFYNTGADDATINVEGGEVIVLPAGATKTYADPAGRPYSQQIEIDATNTTVIATVNY